MSARSGPAHLIAATALLLSVAACGGDSIDVTTTTEASGVTTTTTATTTGAPTPTGEPAPALAGTSWKVTDYALGTSITNVWDDSEVTMEFEADGTLRGSTGCNEYTSGWTVEGAYDAFESGVRDAADGQIVRFGPTAVTERACPDERLMEQENDFLGLLESTGRWLLARGNLILRTADGSFLLEAEPAG